MKKTPHEISKIYFTTLICSVALLRPPELLWNGWESGSCGHQCATRKAWRHEGEGGLTVQLPYCFQDQSGNTYYIPISCVYYINRSKKKNGEQEINVWKHYINIIIMSCLSLTFDFPHKTILHIPQCLSRSLCPPTHFSILRRKYIVYLFRIVRMVISHQEYKYRFCICQKNKFIITYNHT